MLNQPKHISWSQFGTFQLVRQEDQLKPTNQLRLVLSLFLVPMISFDVICRLKRGLKRVKLDFFYHYSTITGKKQKKSFHISIYLCCWQKNDIQSLYMATYKCQSLKNNRIVYQCLPAKGQLGHDNQENPNPFVKTK